MSETVITINPKISVIVPVYNVEKYLCRCIDSILSQTFRDFELLLIDDGSTDGSGRICDTYAEKDHRVRCFHKKNGGVSSARNMGLTNVNGGGICFVDADDYLFPNALENYVISNADLVLQGYSTTDEGDKVMDSRTCTTHDTIHNALRDIFNYGMFFGPLWNKMLRTDIIRNNHLRFDETCCWREDELFMYQYCCHIESLEILPSIAYSYELRDNSLMHRDWRSPNAIVDVVLKCMVASSKLNPDYYFRHQLTRYFMNTIGLAGWMMYRPKHLLPLVERYKLLTLIHHFAKTEGNKELSRFCYGLPIITDFVHLLWMTYKYKIRHK